MRADLLIEAFSNVNGTSFIGMDTCTVPALTGGKGNPMKGKVTKVMTGASLMVFQNKLSNGYENLVRRRLIAEGKNPDFEVGPRAWGERMPNLPIVTHTGKDGILKHYLEVIFLRAGTVEYFFDGKAISRDAIVGMDGKHDEDGQGGLTDKVIIRTFAADSITKIRVDHQEWV